MGLLFNWAEKKKYNFSILNELALRRVRLDVNSLQKKYTDKKIFIGVSAIKKRIFRHEMIALSYMLRLGGAYPVYKKKSRIEDSVYFFMAIDDIFFSTLIFHQILKRKNIIVLEIVKYFRVMYDIFGMELADAAVSSLDLFFYTVVVAPNKQRVRIWKRASREEGGTARLFGLG